MNERVITGTARPALPALPSAITYDFISAAPSGIAGTTVNSYASGGTVESPTDLPAGSIAVSLTSWYRLSGGWNFAGAFSVSLDTSGGPLAQMVADSPTGSPNTVVSAVGATGELTVQNGNGTAGILPLSSTEAQIDDGAGNPIQLDVARLQLTKQTAAAAAPGAGKALLRWEPGTNPGTAKLVVYAGTSATGTTIVDNVGAGF